MDKKEYLQPGLWQDKLSTVDPDKYLFKAGAKFNERFYRYKKSPMDRENKEKRRKLREEIGLPVARGKDHHVNNDFYKFLVRRVCTWDNFKIFGEYNDSVFSEVQPGSELEVKINEVKGSINKLLNTGLNRQQQSKEYWKFYWEYKKKWEVTEE